jgi:hypothetical protein
MYCIGMGQADKAIFTGLDANRANMPYLVVQH